MIDDYDHHDQQDDSHLAGPLFSALVPLSFDKCVRNNVPAEYLCNLGCRCIMSNEVLKTKHHSFLRKISNL